MTTFDKIDSRRIVWNGHLCEGREVHEGIRLLWTFCGKDVPENAAHLREEGEEVGCEVCRVREQEKA